MALLRFIKPNYILKFWNIYHNYRDKMRLSESLRKGVMESKVGGIVNKFKIKQRRNILFFEDILANYLKECERAGYHKEMEDIGMRYGYLGAKCLIPGILKRHSYAGFLNLIAEKVWVNLGLMEHFKTKRSGDIIITKTKGEFITRIIGKNNFISGMAVGILGGFYSKKMEILKVKQNRQESEYVIRIVKRGRITIEHKDKKLYNALNNPPRMKGLTLKDILEKKIFQLKEKNRIYFRGLPMIIVENTLFHLIGNKKILMDRIPHLSYTVFKKILGKRKDMLFLKNLIQITGWGSANIVDRGSEIHVEISNQPYGLQIEKDSWDFLAGTILGYIWLFDDTFKIKTVKSSIKNLVFVYVKN